MFLPVLAGISSATDAAGPFFSGADPVLLGMAGAGVSATGADSYQANPASVSQVERFSFSSSYGSVGGEYSFPYMRLLLPGSYGVIGLGFGYFNGPLDDIDSTGYMFTMGLSKEITSGFLFGLSFNGVWFDRDETSFYGGIKPGFILKFDGMDRYNGFGIFSPAIGFSADAGFGSGEDASLNSATFGYSFDFWRMRAFSLGFYNDISAVESFSAFPVKFGLEFDFEKSWFLRAGAVFPESYSFMTYTAGAGYTYTGETGGVSINYAFAYSGEEGVSHYAGVSFEYGSLDREPPLIAITPDYTYISPNFDGRQDDVIFDTEVTDRSRIKGWKLQITDSNEVLVREFKVSERDIEERLTLVSFIERFVKSKGSLSVPESIMWDGTDSSGKKLPDGKYSYYFYAWDVRENIAPVKSGVIIIDTESPGAELESDSLIFSPNGDKNKETLVIKQKITTSPDDVWKGEIRNSAGLVVRAYDWAGENVPSKFAWDGKGGDGSLLPDGVYYYSLSSEDRAGNRTSAVLNEIILTTVTAVADIRPSAEYFSYGSSKEKYLRFFPELTCVKGLERWEISISEQDGDPVRLLSGTGQVPPLVDWNCRSDSGNLDDGDYYVRLSGWYNNGNNPVSYPKRIIFDNTPPEIGISHSPGIFSPDGDGENDYLTIKTSAKDFSGIANWEIGIYSERGILFRKFTGRGMPPEKFNWDGLGDDGDLVESASDYMIKFSAVDAAGNVSDVATDRLPVDVLVVVTERGLKMRISNIEFGFGSADIKKRGIKILDRVCEILEKYRNYNVVIEGHTDDIGDEEYNLRLSEKRAMTVKQYLVKQGVDASRLKYVGMGESMPFYPNTNDENRRRNRRVEFLLVKGRMD